MKRSLIHFLQIAIAIMFIGPYCGCKKNTSDKPKDTPTQEFISQARAWFQTQEQNKPPAAAYNTPRITVTHTPDWNNASVLNLSHCTVIAVPLHYSQPVILGSNSDLTRSYKTDDITHLLIYQDSTGAFQSELATFLPDSTYSTQTNAPFKGIVLVDQWNGIPITRYHSDGNTVQYLDTISLTLKTATSIIVQTCYEIDGYNYSPDDPSGGVSWSESAGCTTYFLPATAKTQFSSTADLTSIASAGGGITKSNKVYQVSPTVAIGHNIIKDIKSYFNCFQNTTDATYKVTVCVDQPDPGTRTPWTFSFNSGSSSGSNIINPGHTFLIFTENYQGNVIIRNVGFYPSSLVDPGAPASQGSLNNDESHSYNISGTFNINSTLFFNMLTFVEQGNTAGYDYNLNTNNCTTFAIAALDAGHIYLPATTGYWIGGMGNDPGDFGEDLRNSNAPGITKSTDEVAHLNAGTCN